MKICFVDIDGVLNSSQGHEYHRQNQTLRRQDDSYTKDKEDLIASGIDQGIAHDMLMTREFDPICVSNLRKILKDVPDVKIVVCSTWRIGYPLNSPEVGQIFNYLQDIKDRVIDRTKRLFIESDPCQTAQRGVEIKEWVDRHPEVTQYVVLDDDNDFDAVRGNFIRTDGSVGLSYSNTRDAIRVLNGIAGWKPSWFANTCNSCTHYKRFENTKTCVAGTCQMVFHMFQGLKNNKTGERIEFSLESDYSLEVMEDFKCPMHEPVPWKGSNESSLY